MNYTSELGKLSEERAAKFLCEIGYKILGRNYSNQFGELDIIALDESVANLPELVIVEVRCRTLGKIQAPLDTVGTQKLRKLIRTARALIEEIGWENCWRFDVIGITLKKQMTIREMLDEKNLDLEIEHVKDVTSGMNIFS